jgi:hypothetical protein
MKQILEQFQKKDSKEREKQEELDIHEDIDGDALERRMMRNLANERKTIKNWHKVLMRIQMINAFKLSMRIGDQPIEDNDDDNIVKEIAWWESGNVIIYPEKRYGVIWGVLKTLTIFISLFSLSFSAGFLFQHNKDMIKFEIFFDTVQLLDIVITCFTAVRTRDISDVTR